MFLGFVAILALGLFVLIGWIAHLDHLEAMRRLEKDDQ